MLWGIGGRGGHYVLPLHTARQCPLVHFPEILAGLLPEMQLRGCLKRGFQIGCKADTDGRKTGWGARSGGS